MKNRKKWILFLILLLMLGMATVESFGAGTVDGFTYGKVKVIYASANGATAKVQISAIPSVCVVGDSVSISIYKSSVVNSFIGESTRTNRTAQYSFDRVSETELQVDGNKYKEGEFSHTFYREGTYYVSGKLTLRWQPSAAKQKEGFPQYFYRTFFPENIKVIVKKAVEIEPIEPIIPPDKTDPPTEPTDKSKIIGKVYHTDGWNKNRINYNKKNNPKRGRNVFWSGEKFMLSAVASGKKQPQRVSVTIKGTPYHTDLEQEGEQWVGDLFDKSMLNKWGQEGGEELVFVFTAQFKKKEVDNVEIIVDDLIKYWELHRKE
ncbi:MAG: hypothetical protein RR769_02320 [Anaerovoracaceae bacterium]